MQIDITTTAMPRPDILDRCYSSFQKYLIGVDFTECDCYINIDPLPASNERQCKYINQMISATIETAKKHFGNVIVRAPKTPNYAAAYKWLWSKAQSDIILNIEDDWELLRPISVNHLIKKFTAIKTLYQIVFRAYSYVYPTCCTSPSLLHRRWYKPVSNGMNKIENPESQIHKNNNNKFSVFVPNRKTCDSKKHPGKKREIEKYIIPYPKNNFDRSCIIVKDIGKKWIENSPYISPVDLIRREKEMYRKHKHKMDRDQKIYAKKCIESLKKSNFLSWVIRPDVNPLKWLMEYKCK